MLKSRRVMALALFSMTLGWMSWADVEAAPAPYARLFAINGQIAQYLARHTKMSALVAEELPSVNAPGPLYVTANVEATRSHYAIQYWAMTKAKAINQRASTALASRDTHLLTISGTQYQSHAAAQAALPHVPSVAGRLVPLIPGFQATYYASSQRLSWHEGEWTVEVAQGSREADLREGRQIIQALDRFALPPFPGVLTAAPAKAAASSTSIGDVYGLSFADGDAVYQINPFYNHAPNASYGLKAPDGLKSPIDLVEAASRLVPTRSFYNPTVAQVTMTANPGTVHAGQFSMISGQLLSQYGQGVGLSPFSITGLPQTPSYINGRVNQAGRFSLRVFFPKSGTYIISAGDGEAAARVVVHVLSPLMPHPPSVVAKAMGAIAGKTLLPLEGPSVVPEPHGGYLTARAQALPSTYVVFLIDTTRPLAVNSPLINRFLSPHANVAQFSAARLKATQPRPGSPNYLQYLARYNPLFVRSTHAAVGQVDLGLGINAAIYHTTSGRTKTLLDWNEGDWTVQVQGGTLPHDERLATPLVAYLHRYFLPPYPGIVAVQVLGEDRARTEIDWMDQHVLSTVVNQRASAQNPVQAAQMAAHWGPE